MLAAFNDPDEGLNGVTICDVYDYVMGNYVTISQAKVVVNLDTFKETINASCTLAVYIWKQELFLEMAKDVHVPINKATMVTIVTKHSIATSGMDDAWLVLMRLPNDQQTWVRWKTIWSGPFLEQWELVRLTGIAYNGMENQAADIKIGNTMVVALDNLANASVQNNNTVERLVISNSFLFDSLTARDTKIARLLTVITDLSMGGGGGGRERRRHQQQ